MHHERLIPIPLPLRIIAVVCLAGCGTLWHETTVSDIVFPYQWVGNIDQAEFNEPSGICFHSQRGTLFVVGDEGDVCEIQTDGNPVKQKHIRDADFEGITHDPATGLLYIAVEADELILELDPESLKVLREFSIPRTFDGRTVLDSGGNGLEAITFVPDPEHPEGGTFYVANQNFRLDDEQDVSGIFQVQLPLKTGSTSPILAGCFFTEVIDLSGLHFDATTQRLLVISDSTNTIWVLSLTGRTLDAYAFPGDNQEGITVDDQGFIYIAQDTGGIIKMKWMRHE
ncbi:MAG: SdiA-regulated domain-containing protein [Pirellulaceae bacterium]|jgi:uncharacterized protein YjiK|nr:SdiA-regulated domain-containing protein [Pirellulaceae bacterium]